MQKCGMLWEWQGALSQRAARLPLRLWIPISLERVNLEGRYVMHFRIFVPERLQQNPDGPGTAPAGIIHNRFEDDDQWLISAAKGSQNLFLLARR